MLRLCSYSSEAAFQVLPGTAGAELWAPFPGSQTDTCSRVAQDTALETALPVETHTREMFSGGGNSLEEETKHADTHKDVGFFCLI